MSEDRLANLLTTMCGARFDEFTVRVASMRLTFSKNIEGRQALFFVETNADICDSEGEPQDGVASNAILFDALELNLEAVRKAPSNAFRFEFEKGVVFCLADSEHLWDNVFSVRTVDWPERGAQEIYFYL